MESKSNVANTSHISIDSISNINALLLDAMLVSDIKGQRNKRVMMFIQIVFEAGIFIY